jgi:hypothetical protein
MTATNYQTWAAGMTLRWHSNRHMRDANDSVDAHSCRMALELFGDMAIARACLYHDLAESVVCDVPHPAKEMLPAFRTMEAAVDADKGWDCYVDPDQIQHMRLLDRLDAYLMMLHHKPRLRKRDDWRADHAYMLALADAFDVGGEVRDMIREARG